MVEITFKKIYFGTTDGGIVDNLDIAKAAKIFTDADIDYEDLDRIRCVARMACKGITREIENPSVKYLVANGFKTKAVSLWHDKHPGTTLKEAYAAVNRMEKNLTRMYKKGAEKEEKDGSCD